MAGTLREVILQRIQRTVSRETEDDDLPDELELKSDEELLAWYDRFQQLSLVRVAGRSRRALVQRNLRLDPPGFE